MKASATLPFLLLFALACTDSATDPTGLRPPASAIGAREPSDPPPPPADVAVAVCSVGGCVVLDGTYFSHGADEVAVASITQSLDEECAYPEATSWLKFGNHQTDEFQDATATSNAQIRCSSGRAAGRGRIEYQVGTQAVVIEFQDVLFFGNTPQCSVENPFCATFTATVTVNGVPQETPASGQAINRDFYEDQCFVGEGGVYCGGID